MTPLTIDREARTPYMGLAAMLADVKTMGCISLSAIIGLDVILFSFLLLTSSHIFNQQRFWAGHSMNTSVAASPVRSVVFSLGFP